MNVLNTNLTVEQEICIKCGLCCDGTLFNLATVEKGEKEFLPTLLQKRYIVTEKGERFNLPCPYFDKKCTIYNEKKANVCSGFRCQLLKNLSKGKINKTNAEKVVNNAIELRNEIFRIYKPLNKSNLTLSFKELHYAIRKRNETNIVEDVKDKQLELLMFKSNILEILLIKYFKSTKEYESLMME